MIFFVIVNKPLGFFFSNFLATIFHLRQAYKKWKEAEETSWRLPPRRQSQPHKRVWENPKMKNSKETNIERFQI